MVYRALIRSVLDYGCIAYESAWSTSRNQPCCSAGRLRRDATPPTPEAADDGVRGEGGGHPGPPDADHHRRTEVEDRQGRHGPNPRQDEADHQRDRCAKDPEASLCDQTDLDTTPTRHRHHAEGGGPRRGRSHQEEYPCRESHPHLRCVQGGDPRGGHTLRGQIRTDECVSTAVYTDGSKNHHRVP